MSNEKNAQAITDAILSSGADLVNVMESEPLLGHLAALSSVYPYRLGCGVGTVQCDLMILSKRPLRSAGIYSLSELFEERLLVVQVDFAGRDIHIAAIHATKPSRSEERRVGKEWCRKCRARVSA